MFEELTRESKLELHGELIEMKKTVYYEHQKPDRRKIYALVERVSWCLKIDIKDCLSELFKKKKFDDLETNDEFWLLIHCLDLLLREHRI